jgi:hypothetical protein
MAQIPIFKFKDFTFEAPLTKVDRKKVYGWVETKYTDDKNNPCNFLTLLDDGKTMVGSGGMGLKSIDETGNEIDKSTLVARYADGSEATLFPSVFEGENELSTEKTLEDYLSMDVKSVYQLNVAGNTKIFDALKTHTVLYFSFNYRANYDPDDAFILAQNENLFVVVGKINEFVYAELKLPAVLIDDEEEDSDEIDFNMF